MPATASVRSRSLVDAMARAWRDPRGAMAAQLAEGLSEARALMHLMLACGLLFVASVPAAMRQARGLAIDDPLAGTIAAHLFGYLFLLPLIAYGAAALVHLVAGGFGGRGGFSGARAAVFWSMLLGAPLALILAVGGAVADAAPVLLPAVTLLGYAGLAFWLWLFSASLAEAEGFGATGRVLAVVALVFAALAALMAVLAGDLAPTV